MIKQIANGFLVKLVTGFDDTLVHIPIISTITKTKLGKLAFILGILLAIIVAVTLSILFAQLIRKFPYYQYISAGLIFALAISILFNTPLNKPKENVKKKLEKKKLQGISKKRFFKLLGLGFIAAFATVIDDSIAYSALFLNFSIYPIIGIFTATTLELLAIFYFSRTIKKMPFKREITITGLFVLGILILFEII